MLKSPVSVRARVPWPSTFVPHVPVRRAGSIPIRRMPSRAVNHQSGSASTRVNSKENEKNSPTNDSKVSRRFTMIFKGNPQKELMLHELGRRMSKGMSTGPMGEEPTTNPAVAILVSRHYAKWVENEFFLTEMINKLPSRALGSTNIFKRLFPSRSMDVLVGVVDGIDPCKGIQQPQKGISFLYADSTATLLPGLWDDNFCSADEHDTKASIHLPTQPLSTTGGMIAPTFNITLPLANTIFQTGRHSTLFAARYEVEHKKGWRLVEKRYKTNQFVVPERNTSNNSFIQVPLLPITPPRKIVAGMGNIVRLVDVDGRSTPASKELEVIIPQIIEARSRNLSTDEANSSAGPMGVWALVIPRDLAESPLLSRLSTLNPQSPDPEADLTERSPNLSPTYSELLSRGCRFHRILSGGGGWGPKQGLLSLDPELKCQQPEDNFSGLEAFLASRQGGEADESATDGLVAPGSRILFCIEPSTKTPPPTPGKYVVPASEFQVRLGVTSELQDGTSDVEESPNAENNEKIIYKDGFFGGSSVAGLFLTKRYEDDPSAMDGPSSKIDVPGALVYTGKS